MSATYPCCIHCSTQDDFGHTVACERGCEQKPIESDRSDADRRADAELRDRLDALDDAQTEAVLDTLLRDAPDLHRKALRELSLIDADAVNDALNETGA